MREGAAAHPLGLRPLEPSGNGGGGPGCSRGEVADESFSGPCRGTGADMQPPARPPLPHPVLPLPPPPRGGVFSGGDGAVSFNYPASCACAAGAAHPVPSRSFASHHRALAGSEGLRLKAPQSLGEAPGRRCVWRGAGKPGVAARFRERLWDVDPSAPGGLVRAASPLPPH